MLGSFMFAGFVGTRLRLLRLALDGLFAAGSLWSLSRMTSNPQFLWFLPNLQLHLARPLMVEVGCFRRLALLHYS
jgi:hypothetical protein